MSYEALLSAQHNRPLFTARHGGLGNAGSAGRDRLETLQPMQKVQVHDEDTLGSGSGSGVSDISALENETDTLGRAIMQHERDARRLRDVLNADQPPLLKTRARPRVAGHMARQERQETFTSTRHQDRVGSSGSNDSEPPLNVPREWGVRARSHRGWMRKIREPSEADIQLPEENGAVKDEAGLDGDAIAPHRTAYSGDDYWSPPTHDGLPAVEDTPPSMNRKRTSSEPDSLRHMNTTLRDIMDSGDQEFSELSLLASTPAVTRTRPTIGSPARREADRIEEKERASRGLQQLSARLASNRLHRHRSRDRAASPTRETAAATATETFVPRPVTAPPASTRPRVAHRRSLIGNKENQPVTGMTGSQYKGSETVTITDRTAQAVTFKQPRRPGHNRNDSMKLLQRLARVSSMSPSPKGSSSDGPANRTEQDTPNQRPRTSHGAPTVDRHTARETSYRGSNTVTTTRSLKEHSRERDMQRRSIAKANHDQENDEPPAPVDETDELLQFNLRSSSFPTANRDRKGEQDHVTDVRPLLRTTDSAILRAFGTPSGEAALENPNPQESVSARKREVPERSNRPRSALEDIVLEARNNPGGTFGDATIQSLEDIAHPSLDASDTTLTVDASANATQGEAEVIKLEKPVTQAEKDRRQEDLAIEAMNRHLRAARTSIKDADRGLRRVENRVDHTTEEPVETVTATTTDAPKVTEVKKVTHVTNLTPNWCTTCEHCGGSYRSVSKALFSESLHLFYTPSPTSLFGIRLTWLGMLILTMLLWHIAEKTLCRYYCHPEYAEWMWEYGVDPDAPQYPFVLLTLVFRPIRPLWRPVLDWADQGFVALANIILGEGWDEPVDCWAAGGYDCSPHSMNKKYQALRAAELARQSKSQPVWSAKWTGSVASSTVAVAARVTRSFVDAVDEIGRMGDDEYLA